MRNALIRKNITENENKTPVKIKVLIFDHSIEKTVKR
jgi:hypothetical protein